MNNTDYTNPSFQKDSHTQPVYELWESISVLANNRMENKMNTLHLRNTVWLTVVHKNANHFTTPPIWNKVAWELEGSITDVLNLMEELKHIKAFVNKAMNERGLALRDVDIKIEFIEDGV